MNSIAFVELVGTLGQGRGGAAPPAKGFFPCPHVRTNSLIAIETLGNQDDRTRPNFMGRKLPSWLLKPEAAKCSLEGGRRYQQGQKIDSSTPGFQGETHRLIQAYHTVEKSDFCLELAILSFYQIFLLINDF